MCRWMAYSGNPVPLELLLFKAKHNLIDQSMSSRSKETPTNGDGFGVGWYGSRPLPGLFRSIRPAWNDFNLRDLAAQVDSHMFLAHVRAASQAMVQESNCHPFRHEKWLFVHNGEVHGIEKLRRDMLLAVDPALFPCIQGTTDSELMFFLCLSLGLEGDPLGALARMAGLVEGLATRRGIETSLWMTVCVSDGQALWAVRYASDGKAPTLYHSKDAENAAVVNPEIAGALGPNARVIVSEPIGRFREVWAEVAQQSSVYASDGTLELRPFAPVPTPA